ncbi:MAG TPA: permease prefix domain 1-containing protein [Trebonia sp.]
MIDAYIGELEHRLRGPRRVKADLLAEARDALIDAASAYERGGLAPQAAEARAVDDFGAVDEIGPEYQTELAFSQGRATALALFFILIVQAAAWQIVWPVIRPEPAGDPTPVAAALGGAFAWVGAVALVGSLVGAVACGVGVRRLSGACSQVIRATGAFALAVAVSLTALGVVLGWAAPRAGSLLSLSVGLPWAFAFLLVPMASVAVLGRRCLAAAPQRLEP